jgi:hypothetical protein
VGGGGDLGLREEEARTCEVSLYMYLDLHSHAYLSDYTLASVHTCWVGYLYDICDMNKFHIPAGYSPCSSDETLRIVLEYSDERARISPMAQLLLNKDVSCRHHYLILSVGYTDPFLAYPPLRISSAGTAPACTSACGPQPSAPPSLASRNRPSRTAGCTGGYGRHADELHEFRLGTDHDGVTGPGVNC